MKLCKLIILLYIIAFLSFSCNDKDFAVRPYPKIITSDVTDIDGTGATFHAEVFERGSAEIIHYGFLWSTLRNAGIRESDKIFLEEDFPSENFTARVSRGLRTNSLYFVRSFVQTEKNIVYGQVIEFLSEGSFAPKIFSISPSIVRYGDTLEIRGENFGSGISNNVRIGRYFAIIIEATDSLNIATVPYAPLEIESTLSLSIAGFEAVSDQPVILAPIQISAANPNQASAGEIITLSGTFGVLWPTNTQVLFNGIIAEIIDVTREEIEVRVPEGLANPIEIVVNIGNQSKSFASFEYSNP